MFFSSFKPRIINIIPALIAGIASNIYTLRTWPRGDELIDAICKSDALNIRVIHESGLIWTAGCASSYLHKIFLNNFWYSHMGRAFLFMILTFIVFSLIYFIYRLIKDKGVDNYG